MSGNANVLGRARRKPNALLALFVLATAVAAFAFTSPLVEAASPVGGLAAPSPTLSLSNAGASAASSPLTLPVHDTPAFQAAVNHVVAEDAVSKAPTDAYAARTYGASLDNLSPDEILSGAGLGNVVPLINAAYGYAESASAESSLHPDVFGSWQNYLEAAGVGCLTAGASAIAGAVATQATKITTVVTTEEIVGGTEVTTVGTRTDPAVFALTCVIGGAVGVVLYQMGLNEAPKINYAGLWTAFAQYEYAAFYNAANLTVAMYASLASLLNFAQVGFARMADNAALLQLGSPTFSIAQDLTVSGLAYELAGLVTDFELQIGYDFENVPQWLDALTGQGAGFDGYGYLTVSSAAGGDNVQPATNVAPNATGDITNTTAAGLELTAGTTSFLWGSINETNVYATCPRTAVTACHFYLSSPTATGKPAWYWNLTAGTYALPRSFGFGPAVFNLTVSGGSGGFAILPFASLLPTAVSKTVGTFAWEDRYKTLAGAKVVTGHNGGGCVYSTAPVGDDVLGSVAGVWANVATEPVDYVEFILNSAGGCGNGGTQSAVTGALPWYDITSCAVGSGCYQTAALLATTVGTVEYNATLSGETYWAFVRSLGYTSLSEIPPDCVIPAPYQALPSQVNIGVLTLNESIALYTGWLRSIGNFYGQNPSLPFNVCSQPQRQWSWLNSTYLFVAGTAEFGGVYLNNGTSPIGPDGGKLTSEHFGTTTTWALPASVGASGATAYYDTFDAGTANSALSVATADGVTVTVGETLVVNVNVGAGTSGAPKVTAVADTAGNVFHRLAETCAGTAGACASGYADLWVDNLTTKAANPDVVTATLSLAGGTGAHSTIQAFTFSSASGINGFAVGPQISASGTATQISLGPWTVPAKSTSLVILDNLWDATANVTAPPSSSASIQTTATNAIGFAYPTPLAAGATTYKLGYKSAGFVGGFALSIGGIGSTAALNESLIIAPFIKSTTIPQGQAWPVNAYNPLMVFWATRNGSQNITSSGNWSILNALILTGNGTTNGTNSVFGSAKAGDAVYLTGCETNFTFSSGACAVTVSNWTVYLVKLLCGTNSTCPSPYPSGGGPPPSTTTCGDGIPFFGTIADYVANAAGSIPIIGGLAQPVGCVLGWVLAVIIGVVLLVIIAYLAVAVVRLVRGTAPKRRT